MNKNITPLFALAMALNGCAVAPAIVLYPHATTASIAGMNVKDERDPIEPSSVLKRPLPDQATMLNGLSVLPNNMRAADLLASLVAIQFPGAAVTVKRFNVGSIYLVYANIARAEIVAEIAPVGGTPFVIEAEGKNPNYAAGPRNDEIAMDRALDDFARKLESMRALKNVAKTP